MGFFSRFFGKQESTPEQPKVQEKVPVSVPTVKASPEYGNAYSAVFYEVMGTVEPFTKAEVDAIYAIINTGPPAFEQHFADKDCYWPELEEWNAAFTAAGRAPLLGVSDPRAMNTKEMCGLLKTSDIKEALKNLEISHSAKDTKEVLIGHLEAIAPEQFTAACPAWQGAMEKQLAKRRLQFFQLLVSTIQGRATSLDGRMRLACTTKDSGKWDLHTSRSEDKVFVEMALKKNPEAVPPFFPGDWTIQTPVITAFSRGPADIKTVEAAAERRRKEDNARRGR